MAIAITKSDKMDYDGEQLWNVTIDGIVIGTVRKDTTTTHKMSGRIRVGSTVRKGWSWTINTPTRRSVNMNVHAASSLYVETSKVKAVAQLVRTYEAFAARV